MKRLLLAGLLLGLLVPAQAQAATCADFSTQAAAQRAANTRDADGDGLYCESLPCPCATAGGGGSTTPPPPPSPPPAQPNSSGPAGCTRPRSVQVLTFSRAKYPNIRAHALRAIAKGWPRIMVVDRPGDGQRRDRLLQNIPTKSGFDRDEYPAAIGRGRANGSSLGLIRGIGPLGWMADVEYVPSGENRSHGASMGAKLRRFCNGTRFRYGFA